MLFSVPQEPAHPPEEEAVPTLGALWRRALLLKGMARGGAVSNQEATKPESSDSMTAAPHMSDESEPMHAPDDLPTADGLPDDEGGGWRTSSRESSHGGGLWDDDQEPSGAEVDRVLWDAGAQEVGESEP
jgi:hypothetical protein